MADTQTNVLVIDDNDDHRLLIQVMLQENGTVALTVDCVSSGAEGRARLRDGEYAACLLDYKLGDQDGLDLLRAVRADGITTPIIFLTSHGDESIAVEAMKAGASDYLRKESLSSETLVRSIQYVLQMQRQSALQRRNVVLETLAELTHEVATTFDLTTVLERVARLTVQAMDVTSAYVAEVNEELRTVTVVAEYVGPQAADLEKTSDVGTIYDLDEDFGDPRNWLFSDKGYWLEYADDPALDPRDRAHMQQHGAKSVLGLPMLGRGKTIGFIEIWESRRRREFTQEEISTVRAIARQMGLAVHNARLYASQQRRNVVLETLNELSQEKITTLELNEILDAVVKLTGEALQVTSAYVADWDQEAGTSTTVAEYYSPEAVDRELVSDLGVTYSLEEDFADLAIWLQNEDEYWVHHVDGPDVEPEEKAHMEQYGGKTVMGVPLVADGVPMGSIELWESRRKRDFTREEIEILQAVARQVSMTIHNAQLYEALRSHSEHLEQEVAKRTTELRREKEQAEAIFRSTADMMALVDTKGHILAVNAALEEQIGYRGDEITGQHISLLASEKTGQQEHLAAIESIREGLAWRNEVVIRRRDGSEFEADVSAAPLVEGDGEVWGYVATMRDISAQKELARMKDAFVSNVSHELRTPITGLKLYLSLLESVLEPEVRDEYMPTLKREADRLNRIIENVLRLSRLDQGRVEMELALLDLNALTEQYVADRQPLAARQDLTLSFEGRADLPTVEGDKGLLGQALSVLLTNALHYTPAGGEVTTATQVNGSDGTQWVGFSVSDTGPGIPREEQEQLFERFFRGQVGRESDAPGTGLGLSIAREIVDRHGGRIEVESEGLPGKGTTFRVWLPSDR